MSGLALGAALSRGNGLVGGNFIPTLALDFTTLNNLSPAFTSNISFSRPSLATMTDANGYLTYAPNNLLTYSNTFSNTAWAKTTGVTVSGNVLSFGSGLGNNGTLSQSFVGASGRGIFAITLSGAGTIHLDTSAYGDPSQLAQIIAISQAAGVTIYELVTPTGGGTPFWTSDGNTPAPSYVSSIGVIA